MTRDKLKLLILEDVEDDALLVVRSLKKAGMAFDWERVDNGAAFQQALGQQSWDVIISDYCLPGFDALHALQIVRERRLIIPFIIVSGTIGEDVAVGAMREGADDYVMKGNLTRLAPAVERELREASVKRERYAAEDALRRSEEQMSGILSSMEDLVFTLCPDGTFTTIHCPGGNRWCFLDENMLGQKIDEVLPTDVADLFLRALQTNREHEPAEFEYELDVHEQHRWFSVKQAPLFVEGEYTGSVAVVRDITQRKRAELQLRESEHKYRAIIEAFDGFIYICSPDYRIEFMNENLIRRTGHDATGEPCYEALHDLHDICPWCVNDRVLQGETVRWELQSPKDNRWYYCVNSPIRHTDGTVSKQSMILDITERKASEEALRESEEKFRNLSHQSPNMIFIHAGGQIVYANPKCEELLGHPRRELTAGRFDYLDLIHPEDRALVQKQVHQQLEHRETPPAEYRLVAEDGRVLHALVTTKLIEFDKQRAVMAIVTDVTDLKTAEEARKRLFAAVEAAEESILITDAKGLIQYVNPCFAKLTGYSYEEAVGKSTRLLKSGKHPREFYREMWETIQQGRTWRGHLTNRRKDGSLFEEEAVISPVRAPDGTISNYVAVKRDVTQQMALEQQLRHSQKMDAIGRLAAGVAHDFTNILLIMTSSAQLAKTKLPADSEAHEFLDQIMEAANKSSAMTAELLAFAHQQPISPRTMDLNKALWGVEEMLYRAIHSRIQVVVHKTEEPLPTEIDPAQIEQVLVHLAVNAGDAMPDGGQLTITTDLVHFSREETFQLQYGVDDQDEGIGGFAVLAISDTGGGMSPETQAHAFEPFYTTKGTQHSTGLGLSTVYGIIKQHHGYVSVYSDEGKGTTFQIYFPLKDESILPPVSLPKGSETILLCENDPLVRRLVVRTLNPLGYHVLEAENEQQALDLAAGAGPLDLLLTDIYITGMGGLELARQLTAKQPGLRVLLASGYPRRHLQERGGLSENDPFLAKPLTRYRTAQLVREVLDRAVPPPDSKLEPPAALSGEETS